MCKQNEYVTIEIIDNMKFRNIYHQEDIVKHSSNIIDLIEVGDYVNGFLVSEVKKVPNEEIGKVVVTDTSNCDCYEGLPIDYTIEEVKTIVTKEQFANMEYKVEE